MKRYGFSCLELLDNRTIDILNFWYLILTTFWVIVVFVCTSSSLRQIRAHNSTSPISWNWYSYSKMRFTYHIHGSSDFNDNVLSLMLTLKKFSGIGKSGIRNGSSTRTLEVSWIQLLVPSLKILSDSPFWGNKKPIQTRELECWI